MFMCASCKYSDACLKGVGTFYVEATLSKIDFVPSEKSFSVKGNLCSQEGAKISFYRRTLFVRYRIDPFSEGAWCARKETESH